MVSSKCFVPGCKTGYDSDKKKRKAEGKRNLSLFRPPLEVDKLKKWNIAIPRADRDLSINDKVCELHFLPEDISRCFIHKMPDGTEVVIEREKVSLAANAVPLIFPNLPSFFTKVKKKRNSPAKKNPLPKKAKRENVQPEKITVHETAPLFTFDYLLKNVSEVCKPNKLWAVSSHEDFIICVKWNLNYIPERQVVIDANFSIKIMYCGTEVSVMSNAVIESVESLSLIIKEVDQYAVCSGAINGNENCSVYMEREWGTPGRPQKYCIGCKKYTSKPQHLKQNKPKLVLKYKNI